ncbi:hypothetical protein, partial [Paramuribaculum intestinale]|uniref:hypothetical protein n=1 Tax=Paramuribaculum intestinale TaxID=2094151 RepID=UPI002729869F
EGEKMADKKLVEAITSMEEDFAQWYTDVVKKEERRRKNGGQEIGGSNYIHGRGFCAMEIRHS